MTWVCPACETPYPDSGIGIDGKGCMGCVVDFRDLVDLIELYRDDAEFHENHGNSGECRAYRDVVEELEALVDGELSDKSGLRPLFE